MNTTAATMRPTSKRVMNPSVGRFAPRSRGVWAPSCRDIQGALVDSEGEGFLLGVVHRAALARVLRSVRDPHAGGRRRMDRGDRRRPVRPGLLLHLPATPSREGGAVDL